jgi:hypothetical protein
MSKLLLLMLAMLLWAPSPEAAPIAVRLAEGNYRGFLVLRSPDGTAIAHGEQSQRPVGNALQSRLHLKFKDGSVFDETFTYTQAKVFRLERYHLVQQGPSFPTTDVSFDRKSGQYQARTQTKKGDQEKTASGPLEIPDDVYNGLAPTLLKNLSAGASTTARMAAFTPKPIMLKMELSTEGADRVSLGGRIMKAKRHLVKVDVAGLKGVIAPLVGKDPPDGRYWLVAGSVPAFVRFEGAMFLNGPVWRLELTTVGWPK